MATKTSAASVPRKARKTAAAPRTARAPAAKPAAKPVIPVAAVKPASVPAPTASKPAAKAVKSNAKSAKKPPKNRPQLVRDSFTMPQDDFALIAALKSRALGANRHAKKSELLRAGLRALAALDAQALVASLDRLQPIKVGRPKKGH